jgi:hypothetical protein
LSNRVDEITVMNRDALRGENRALFALGRIVSRVFAQRTEGWEEAERADAGFDAGEWSGPAWSHAWEDEMEATIDYVASVTRNDRRHVAFAYEFLMNAPDGRMVQP